MTIDEFSLVIFPLDSVRLFVIELRLFCVNNKFLRIKVLKFSIGELGKTLNDTKISKNRNIDFNLIPLRNKHFT